MEHADRSLQACEKVPSAVNAAVVAAETHLAELHVSKQDVTVSTGRGPAGVVLFFPHGCSSLGHPLHLTLLPPR